MYVRQGVLGCAMYDDGWSGSTKADVSPTLRPCIIHRPATVSMQQQQQPEQPQQARQSGTNDRQRQHECCCFTRSPNVLQPQLPTPPLPHPHIVPAKATVALLGRLAGTGALLGLSGFSGLLLAPMAPAHADGSTTRFVLPPVDEKDKSRYVGVLVGDRKSVV